MDRGDGMVARCDCDGMRCMLMFEMVVVETL